MVALGPKDKSNNSTVKCTDSNESNAGQPGIAGRSADDWPGSCTSSVTIYTASAEQGYIGTGSNKTAKARQQQINCSK